MVRISCIALAVLISGCTKQARDMSATAAESVTTVAFNPAGAPTVEFSVPDMMCPESCAVKTKEILAEQPGATDVRIDFEAKSATVAVEEGKFDAERALAALVDHGFDHSTLKGDVVAKPLPAPDAATQ